jgi:hypothetical protein
MTAAVARRCGYIAFGLVLLAGMGAIVWRALHGHPDDAGQNLALTWLGAVVTAALVWGIARIVKPIPGGDALLRASLVIPALGLACALPLSMHGLWALLIHSSAHAYDDWFDTSLRVVGFAHVVFMLLFAVHARQLATTNRPAMSIAGIYGWTVLASCVPLGMWILPEVLTAITGLPILIVMLVFDEIAARERTALPALPRAIVAPCRG